MTPEHSKFLHAVSYFHKLPIEGIEIGFWDHPGRVSGKVSQHLAKASVFLCSGIDGSTRIAGLAQQIVRANGLAAETGGPISIVAGRVEEINRLPVEKVPHLAL